MMSPNAVDPEVYSTTVYTPNNNVEASVIEFLSTGKVINWIAAVIVNVSNKTCQVTTVDPI